MFLTPAALLGASCSKPAEPGKVPFHQEMQEVRTRTGYSSSPASKHPVDYRVLDIRGEGPVISQIVDAQFGADSSVYVLDAFGSVWHFDSNLRIRSIFREQVEIGHDPRAPLSLVQDSLLVGMWDAAGGAIHWFNSSGAMIRQDRIASRDDAMMDAFAHALEPPRQHGRMIRKQNSTYVEVRQREDLTTDGKTRADLIVRSTTGVDTLRLGRTSAYATQMHGVWLRSTRSPMFAAQIWWGVLRDGRIIVADAARPAINLLDRLTSEQTAFVTWAAERKLVTKSEVLDYIALSQREILTDSSDQYRRTRLRWVKNHYDHFGGFAADSFPYFSQLIVDASDNIWLRRFDPRSWPDGLSAVFDVFTSAGKYCAVVNVPDVDYVFDINDSGLIATRRYRKYAQELILVRGGVCAEADVN